MTQYQQVATRAQRLRAQAAEAAEVRDALTHPDVVALRVEKLRTVVDRFIWTGMVLGLLFTMTNVQQFTAHTTVAGPGSLGWWASWLLDPTVSVILLGVLIAERVVSRLEVTIRPWARAAKWSLLCATYVMNTWESWAAPNVAGIVLHSVPPLAVFMGAEALTDCQEMLTECVHRAHAAAVTRATERAEARRTLAEAAEAAKGTERADRLADAQTDAQIAVLRSETGVTVASNAAKATASRTGPAVFGETVSDRSGTTPQTGPGGAPRPFPAVGPDRPGDRSRTDQQAGPSGPRGPVQDGPGTRAQTGPGPRSGPSRKAGPRRSGAKPGPRSRTDDELLQDVRELAETNGGEPTKYQIKQALGIGNDRAARLLDQLDPVPVGPPVSNGAAKAGEH